jgi:hypothetical protein
MLQWAAALRQKLRATPGGSERSRLLRESATLLSALAQEIDGSDPNDMHQAEDTSAEIGRATKRMMTAARVDRREPNVSDAINNLARQHMQATGEKNFGKAVAAVVAADQEVAKAYASFVGSRR